MALLYKIDITISIVGKVTLYNQHEVSLGLKKKVFDWRNLTDPIYPADPTYLY